ncbi:unnamed protein product [Mytilus coruscus]|uniref:Chromo domain-containing protein n=1 Tax=Mytilus coruscus TaxID=42192 RepID=A0A6J8DB47_MYTCO|nr:unnamed protein product [Mytilus coruscus]
MNLPFDASVLPKDNLSEDAKHHLEEIISNLKITQDLAAQNIKLKQAKMKERYDINSKIPEFRLRDKVLLKEHVVPVGRSPKLVDKYNDYESTDSETDSDNGDEPNNVIDNTFHEVEKLLNNRNARGIQYFLVKWKDGSKPTWEPKQNIGEGLIQEYLTRKTKKGRRRKQRKYFKRP